MTEAYRRNGWGAEVLSYSADLPRLMAESDLVLGRAGGTTLAEIAVIGVPAVLVPYPHHRDRHQHLNARSFEEGGAACVLDERTLDPGSLRKVFEDILFVPERLEAMGRSARSMARPGASDSVLDLALDLSKSCRSPSASFS
jgi:UDP-N-acetylglucosamine--N-acetylmuramyl-(pentapeptide) pyrophosphoryl-undecaprenol N-acetylglucosamine transferase